MAHKLHRTSTQATHLLGSSAGASSLRNEKPRSRDANLSGAHRIVVRPPQTSFIDSEWEQEPFAPAFDDAKPLKAPQVTRSDEANALLLPFAMGTADSGAARVTVRPPQTSFIDAEWEVETVAHTTTESEIREILARVPRSHGLGKRGRMLIALLGVIAFGLVQTSYFSSPPRAPVRQVARHPRFHQVPMGSGSTLLLDRVNTDDEATPEPTSAEAATLDPSTAEAPKPVPKKAALKPRRAKPTVTALPTDDSVNPSTNPSSLQPTIPDQAPGGTSSAAETPPVISAPAERSLERGSESL